MVATKEFHSPSCLIETEDFVTQFEQIANGNSSQGDLIKLLGKTDVLVSTKPHKARAVHRAFKDLGVKRNLARLPIGHIDEPNGDRHVNTLIRGKALLSLAQFAEDYPWIMGALNYYRGREIEMNLLIQDVRPGVGGAGNDLRPMTNPEEQDQNDIAKYIKKQFGSRKGATTVRLQNAFDRLTLQPNENGRINSNCFTCPAVGSMYITYDRNPLNSREKTEEYLFMCRQIPGNSRLEKNMKAAGGLLNEVLLVYALINEIEVGVSLIDGIQERIKGLDPREILSGLYPQAIIHEMDRHVPQMQDGRSGELWMRNLAAAALSLRDFAQGGSYDAIKALYGQVEAGPSPCRDVNAYINLEPNRHFIL